MRLPRLLLIALPSVLAWASVASANLVALRDSARVAAGAAVTLADIADLKGDDADRLAKVEIARGAAEAFEITKETVRAKLAAAGAGTSSLRISGERVVVRPMRAPKATVAGEAGSAKKAASSKRPPLQPVVKKPDSIDPARHAGNGTPLGVVCELLGNAFGADARTLRLQLSEPDLAKLEPKPGFRYEVSARSALKSDFVSFEVAAIDGDDHVFRERIRVGVRLLREVCVATSESRRGRPLAEGAFTTELREIAPSLAARAATASDIEGASFARSIDSGLVIANDDLARAAVVKRNDRVIVRREVGAVAIEIEAIALEDGRLGDRISLARSGAPRSRGKADAAPGSFVAEVVGSGRAVIR